MIVLFAAFIQFAEPSTIYYLEPPHELPLKVSRLLESNVREHPSLLSNQELILALSTYFNYISRDDQDVIYPAANNLKKEVLHRFQKDSSSDCNFKLELLAELIRISKKYRDTNLYGDPVVLRNFQTINLFVCELFEHLKNADRNSILKIFYEKLNEDDFIYLGSILCSSPIGLKCYASILNNHLKNISAFEIFTKTINNFIPQDAESLYKFLAQIYQRKFLETAFLLFDYNEKARILFKNLLHKDDFEQHIDLYKCCYSNGRPQLLEVLFSLIPKYFKQVVITEMEKDGVQYTPPRPGTLGSEHIYYVKFGTAETYFYMDLDKYEAARKIVEDYNNNSMLTICAAEFPLPTIEVSTVSSHFDEPIGYDKSYHPVLVDTRGTNAIEDYTSKVIKKISERLGLKMLSPSRQMSLVVSHDAMRFHQDQLPRQYAYLNRKGSSFPKCWLGQDLALMDWDMSPGTISGTLIQDGPQGDRFYLVLNRGEVTTNFTLDPAIYPLDGSPPVYLGPTTLPPHSATAPIDLYGDLSFGASKGKRISNVARGVVLEEDIVSLRKQAFPLPINRPSLLKKDDSTVYEYNNDLIRVELHNRAMPNLIIDRSIRLPPHENIEILHGIILNQRDVISFIEEIMNVKIKNKKVDYYKLIKRGSGFSRIDALGLNIQEDSMVVLLNRSQFPPNYDYYPLAEDCTAQNCPWIQMYRFPPNAIISSQYKTLKKLTLAPLEELFQRNAVFDAKSLEVPFLLNQFTTELDMVVIKNE